MALGAVIALLAAPPGAPRSRPGPGGCWRRPRSPCSSTRPTRSATTSGRPWRLRRWASGRCRARAAARAAPWPRALLLGGSAALHAGPGRGPHGGRRSCSCCAGAEGARAGAGRRGGGGPAAAGASASSAGRPGLGTVVYDWLLFPLTRYRELNRFRSPAAPSARTLPRELAQLALAVAGVLGARGRAAPRRGARRPTRRACSRPGRAGRACWPPRTAASTRWAGGAVRGR